MAASDHGEWRAEKIIEAGLAVIETTLPELKRAAKSDWRKGLLAELIQSQTTTKLGGISERIGMGDPSSCC